MKSEYKVNKRTVIEYLLIGLLGYVLKNVVFGFFGAGELPILIKGCAIVGMILLIVALGMTIYEGKARRDFTTGDPVWQQKFSSNEDFAKAKEEMPSSYWYSRANLERQYVVVSSGVLGGLGVALFGWNHIAFAVCYVAVLLIGYFIKKTISESGLKVSPQ